MHSICIFTWTAIPVFFSHCKQTEIAQSILCNNYNIGKFLIGIIALLYAALSQYCWENWLEKQVLSCVFLPGITKIGLYKCVDSARMSSLKLQLKWLHIIVLFLQCCVSVVICMNHVPWPLSILAEYAYATNFFSSATVFCHVNRLYCVYCKQDRCNDMFHT